MTGTLVIAAAVAAAPGAGTHASAAYSPQGEKIPGGDAGTAPVQATHCAPDDEGLSLPGGFCAIVVHEGVGSARHIDVAANGDLFVAVRGSGGGVVALRDSDADGAADVVERWGGRGGNDVLLHEGWLYFAAWSDVVRYPLPEGSLTPSGQPETIVSGLPDGGHGAKSIAISGGDTLFVNVGSRSNACQEEARTQGSPGIDPCPELRERAGVWAFDANTTNQTQEDGRRYATGLRNAYALSLHPATGALYATVHGRDQLHSLFPDRYSQEESAEKPAEELVKIDEGDDFGWPYCYFDPATDRKVLAPEYGGDGTEVGRCAQFKGPLVDFPAHWAPNDMTFYTGDRYPARFENGAFIAFHGSWNRAPLPQEGYRVVFAPFSGGSPTGEWETFAAGFPEGDVSPRGAEHRPTGVAVGPDGSLYIVDGQKGRIWRIVYREK